jgi:inner membrane protein
MDPLTQGLIGAALPQAVVPNRRLLLWAGCFGLVAGMLADLDVLIRSSSDPLLFLEYHRQFSHAILFIPVGGLVSAGLFHLFLRRWTGLPFKMVWLYCTLGYGTHGLLDAFTSYGTMLWWPLSDERVSFSIISVIDPLFSVPVLVLVVLAAAYGKARFALWALLWAALYLSAAMLQRHAAVEMGASLAASRGHIPVRLDAKPSFGNILVWKVVYEADERFFVDAVRATLAPRVFLGASVLKLNTGRDFPELEKTSRQARDIDRFSRLSDGYLARDPSVAGRIIDVRYSMIPNEIDALWSIGVSAAAGPDAHVTFQTHRGDPMEGLRRLWSMLTAPAAGS